MSDEQKTALENAVAERLEFYGPNDWDAPPEWQHINQVGEILHSVLASGNWPIFSMQPRPTLSTTCVDRCWGNPVRGMAELAAQYSPGGLVSLHTQLSAVMHGRLPVGLKIHSLKPDGLNGKLFYEGGFHLAQASVSAVLPPMGNILVVKEMLGMIREKTGLSFLDNDDFQIQVCSPGELSAKHAAILGICFYLGSDRLRRYGKSDFITSHKQTGGRLIVYGAGNLNHNFTWWGKDETGKRCIGTIPAAVNNRTDVLTCSSLLDIDNVNLVATLLVHHQYGAFWAELGERFVSDVEALLDTHQLSYLLKISWVYGSKDGASGTPEDHDGTVFFDAFSELISVAFQECERIKRARVRNVNNTASQGILFDVQELLRFYRTELEARAINEKTGGTE